MKKVDLSVNLLSQRENMKFIPGILAATVASMAAVTGVVVDQAGNPIPKAFVSVKTAPNLLPDTRTLSSEDGKFSFAKTGAKKATDKQILVVRKTGFLPETLSVEKNKDFGNITLKRDPIEDQIDSILKGMPLEAQIAQMTQPLVEKEAGKYPYGSALHGGGRYSDSFYTTAWKNPIPTSYGKDNVHGMGDVPNATIFPHNIGLGATRDTALVRKIGQVVAEEMWAAHIDLNFAPAVSVPKNEHWGRTYEGFGEKGDLVADMGAAYVRGLQGDHFDAEWHGDHFGTDMETFFKGFTTPMSDHIDAINAWKKEGKKVVVVLITSPQENCPTLGPRMKSRSPSTMGTARRDCSPTVLD